MFLDNDERIIVIEDIDDYAFLNDEDIVKIKSVGIKTLLTGRTIELDKTNLERIDTGMKIIYPIFWTYTISFPELLEQRNRIKDRILELYSMTNHVRHRVQFIYAMPDGGEFPWSPLLTENYPLSDEEIIEFIIDIQRILVQQHNEIWLSFHTFLGLSNNWNNVHLPIVYQALRDEFPDMPFYSIQYAHFSIGGTNETDKKNQYKIKEYTETYGIKFFVGSDYCEGLSVNYDEAMKQKAYGFVVAPNHNENPNKHDSIEDWMIKELQETNKKINEHYK